MLEEDLEVPQVGICMDFGHAFIMGDLVDSIEAVSGHLITTHIHDNDGTRDDHLVPFDGAIEWPGALMATQKSGMTARCCWRWAIPVREGGAPAGSAGAATIGADTQRVEPMLVLLSRGTDTCVPDDVHR